MENKIFDNYEVDCNTCESYWNSQCDGVKVEDKRKCTSYIATRNVDVIKELGKYKDSIKSLRTCTITTSIILLVHLISHLLGWY